jgi:hypothetical protein
MTTTILLLGRGKGPTHPRPPWQRSLLQHPLSPTDTLLPPAAVGLVPAAAGSVAVVGGALGRASALGKLSGGPP